MILTLLGKVCDVTMGQAPIGSTYNDQGFGLPLIAGASDLGELTPSPTRWTTSPTQICQEGDIVLCIRATIGDRNWADRDYCLGRGVAGLHARSEKLDPRYLWHYLECATAKLLHAARGATFLQVNRRDIESLAIPMPATLSEQHHIADILDRADAIRRKRKEAMALTEELLRSAFLGMFGDPVTNPKGWPVKPLGQLLAFLTSGSRGWAEYYADAGELFLRIQNIKQDRLDLSDVAYVRAPDSAEARRTRTSPGDVLLSITADLGRTAVVPITVERAFINQHLAILRPSEVNSEYLSSFLSSEGGQRQIRRLNKGGVKAGLNFDDIRSIDVLLPPAGLQRAFAAAKAQIQSLETLYQGMKQEGDKLFQSLGERAFSGKLMK